MALPEEVGDVRWENRKEASVETAITHTPHRGES
jgi:hypothetical protein